MKREIFKYFKCIFGLFLCSVGIVFIMKANLGFSPWTSFYEGVSKSLSLSLGQVHILFGIGIISIDLYLGEIIGSGSLLSILLFGIFVDILTLIFVLHIPNILALKILFIFLGTFLFTYGTYIHMSAGLGLGALDSLMIGLSKKYHVQTGKIRTILEILALALAFLLGGNIGIGTIIFSLFAGTFLEKLFIFHKCEPQNIKHRELKSDIRYIRSYIKFTKH